MVLLSDVASREKKDERHKGAEGENDPCVGTPDKGEEARGLRVKRGTTPPTEMEGASSEDDEEMEDYSHLLDFMAEQELNGVEMDMDTIVGEFSFF